MNSLFNAEFGVSGFAASLGKVTVKIGTRLEGLRKTTKFSIKLVGAPA
jgi:hypothetical protein